MLNSTPLILGQSDYQRLLQLIANTKSGSAEALEEELGRATVVDTQSLPSDVVRMNSTVTFLDENSNQESTIALVYPHEADIAVGKVSILAPVGIALIGLRPGQNILWPMPGGREKSLRVVAVEPRIDATAE